MVLGAPYSQGVAGLELLSPNCHDLGVELRRPLPQSAEMGVNRPEPHPQPTGDPAVGHGVLQREENVDHPALSRRDVRCFSVESARRRVGTLQLPYDGTAASGQELGPTGQGDAPGTRGQWAIESITVWSGHRGRACGAACRTDIEQIPGTH